MKILFLSLLIFLTVFNGVAQQKQRITLSGGFQISAIERCVRSLENKKDEYFEHEYPEGIILGVGYDLPVVKNKISREPRITYGYYCAYPQNHINLSNMKQGDVGYLSNRYYFANVWQVGIIPHYYYDLTEGDGDIFLTGDVEFSFAHISGKINDNGSRKDFRKSNVSKMFNVVFRTGILWHFDKFDFYTWIGFSSLRFKEYLNNNLPKNTHGYTSQEALFSAGVTFKIL